MRRVYWKFRGFTSEERGAVTVDWVVLTAMAVGISALGVGSIGGAAGTIGDFIVEAITDDEDSPET